MLDTANPHRSSDRDILVKRQGSKASKESSNESEEDLNNGGHGDVEIMDCNEVER